MHSSTQLEMQSFGSREASFEVDPSTIAMKDVIGKGYFGVVHRAVWQVRSELIFTCHVMDAHFLHERFPLSD